MKRAISMLFALLILLTACGQENSESENQSGENFGNMAVTLIWPEQVVLKSGLPGGANTLRAPLPGNITDITMTVTAGDMATKSQNFDADDGEGTIAGVPVGVDRTVTFEGKEDEQGPALYRGVKTGVPVEAESTTTVEITMELL